MCGHTEHSHLTFPEWNTIFYLNNTVGYAQKSLVKALEEEKISSEYADLIDAYLNER